MVENQNFFSEVQLKLENSSFLTTMEEIFPLVMFPTKTQVCLVFLTFF